MYLLDTPAFSETRRRLPSTGFMRFLEVQPPQLLYTSAVVVGELWKGAFRHPDPFQREALQAWLLEEALPPVAGRILPVTSEIGERWGRMNGEAERRGLTLATADSLIAATALVHGLIVVTRNEADFLPCGVGVRNPWSE